MYFNLRILPKIQKLLVTKRMLNAGVLIGPKAEFERITKEVYSLIKYKKNYGPDQLAINYLFYNSKFKIMQEKYNCVILTTKIKYKIINGKFYDEKNKLIPIIHNAGKSQVFRGIKNFGYGPDKNKLKKTHFFFVKPFKKIANILFKK